MYRTHWVFKCESQWKKKDQQWAFVFNIFICLFSSFLFVLKFILLSLCGPLFFSFFFKRLLSSNSSKQNHQKWFHVVQSTWRTFLLASPGRQSTAVVQHYVRKFHFNRGSTARFKDTRENLSGSSSGELHGCNQALSPVGYLQSSPSARVST